jgi:cyclophilin family peptidyl-prolyl cis-trans isomerase
MVGMAHTGDGNNASQFFITFDRADELNRKYTLFGQVRNSNRASQTISSERDA